MAPIDAIWLVFSEDIAFHGYPPTLPLLVLVTLVKNYLKWREIQLAIEPIVGG